MTGGARPKRPVWSKLSVAETSGGRSREVGGFDEATPKAASTSAAQTKVPQETLDGLMPCTLGVRSHGRL